MTSSCGMFQYVQSNEIYLLFFHSRKTVSTPILYIDSLRSKRFQSSYCAKVRARAKKGGRGRGRGEEETLACFLRSPPPPPSFLFLLSSQLSRQTRAETLATQASILTFCQERILQFCSNCESLFNLLVSSR